MKEGPLQVGEIFRSGISRTDLKEKVRERRSWPVVLSFLVEAAPGT
jgi:hypothetical protein